MHLTGPKSALIIAPRAHSDPDSLMYVSAVRRKRGGSEEDSFHSILSSSLRRGEQSKGSPERQRVSRRTRPSFFLLSLFPTSSSRLTLAAALQLSMTHAPPPPLSPFVPPPSASTVATIVATFLEVLRARRTFFSSPGLDSPRIPVHNFVSRARLHGISPIHLFHLLLPPHMELFSRAKAAPICLRRISGIRE